MRSFQVFAAMSPERATEILQILNDKAPGIRPAPFFVFKM